MISDMLHAVLASALIEQWVSLMADWGVSDFGS
jgi:hypothetical protein